MLISEAPKETGRVSEALVQVTLLRLQGLLELKYPGVNRF